MWAAWGHALPSALFIQMHTCSCVEFLWLLGFLLLCSSGQSFTLQPRLEYRGSISGHLHLLGSSDHRASAS